MKPFYSIGDLEALDVFACESPQFIADALTTIGVRMIYSGKEADLSGWHTKPTVAPNGNGPVDAVRGSRAIFPDPELVLVAREALPPRWLAELDDLEDPENPLAGWEGFDEDDPSYPRELDIALQAWRAVSSRADEEGTPKQRIDRWIKATYPDLGTEARERISVVCNWGKKGGRQSKKQKPAGPSR